MSTRDKIVDLAKLYNNVGVSNAKGTYVDLLGPDETPEMQKYFCDPTTSGCALTIRGLWRRLGVKDKRVSAPYIFGKAITWLVAISRERKSWIASKQGLLPQPGDFVLVGGDKVKDGGVEHVFTVLTAVLEGDSVVITSIDGGQKDAKGQQLILQKNRRWTWRSGAYWDVSSQGTDPGSNAPGGRRVMGWGDVEKILEADASKT